MLDRFLARSPVRLNPVVESNSFEFLRGYLMHEHAISFQFSIGAISRNGDFVAREIVDPGFPRGQLVLATLRERHLPVISLSFAEHLTTALQQFGVAKSV